jgi:predicted TIM-barrel fold metal-dependent hydrolase
MVQGVYSNRLQLPSLDFRASDYIRTRVWHGLIDEKGGVPAIAEIGADQVVWGSDFPHTISVGVETKEALDGLFAGVSSKDRAKLVSENAARLFGLG